MATPNYDINYDDKRFTEVETDKKAALNEVDVTYGNMINNSDKYYQSQIDAAQQWADKQTQLQQEKTDFAIEQVEQQKAQAQKDYLKEQSASYVDWQKQSNQYGANAEQMAAQGLTGSGFSESSQVSMYNTYQNRVATARESYNQAVLNYNNAIKDAQLQNNSLLAEIAYNALQTQLELSLQGFQYKNQLIIEQSNKKLEVENTYYNRYQDVLNQINTENALAEEVRQYNQSYAEEVRQFNEEMSFKNEQFDEQIRQFNVEIARLKAKDAQENAREIEKLQLQKEQLEEEKRQFNEKMAEEKRQFDAAQANKGGSGGGSGGGGSITKSSGGVEGGTGQTKDDTTSFKDRVSNKHTDSWIEIPGHGRFSWTEVFAYVKSGQIKETKGGNGQLKYTWVTKTSYNVTPDAKGYAAKQKDLMG